jgi:hypothetical protein
MRVRKVTVRQRDAPSGAKLIWLEAGITGSMGAYLGLSLVCAEHNNV